MFHASAQFRQFSLVMIAACVALPAHAGVFSQATVDTNIYRVDNAFGGDNKVVYTANELPYSNGLGESSAAVGVDSPTFSQTSWSLPGSYRASSVTEHGVNRAFASASNPSVVLDGTYVVNALALSGWHEQITISGGQGAGTLTFSARLDGNITITGSPNSEGRTGLGLAYLHFLTSTAAPRTILNDGIGQGLAFPCGPDDDTCDYDPEQFNSVGLISIESNVSRLFDQTATFVVPFEYDVPFYLYGVLEVNAQAYNSNVAATADFLNTGRITTFVAPQGSMVTLESGAYGAFALPSPVPEPDSIRLALAGLVTGGVLMLLRRRSRSSMSA